MTPKPPFSFCSKWRMGGGFQMSKRRKTAKAMSCSTRLDEASAASGMNAVISSITIEPWSSTPRSRAVTSAAHMPITKSGIATKATTKGGIASTQTQIQKIARPTRVPNVPGAFGARPLPKPSAMKCAGLASRKRTSGRLEVVVSAPIDLHRLAVGAEQGHALAALDLAHARKRDAEAILEVLDALTRVRMRGEAKLVVVASGHDRAAALGSAEVPRPDRGHGNRGKLDHRADAR